MLKRVPKYKQTVCVGNTDYRKYAFMNSYLCFSQGSDVKREQRLIDVNWSIIMPLTLFIKQCYVEIGMMCDLVPHHVVEVVVLRFKSDIMLL